MKTTIYFNLKKFAKLILIRLHIFRYYKLINSFYNWKSRSFNASDIPQAIKLATIIRYRVEDSIFIETGTYLGDTTAALEKYFLKTYTIEPDLTLYKLAKNRFKDSKNIICINNTSEESLAELIKDLTGSVTFYLDGHYSLGNTFLGNMSTPLSLELKVIGQFLKNFENISVIADDVGACGAGNLESGDWPRRVELVEWAEQNNFWWNFEYNMFIAKKNHQLV
jgi:hypothetical protein